MKTSIAAIVSAVLAFILTYLLVPQRRPDHIPPSWFELPGTPVSVDNEPVDDWDQVNEKLRGTVRESLRTVDGNLDTEHAPELPGRGVRITYVPYNSSRADNSSGAATVVVRPWLPITIHYSRSRPEQHARYEIVRPDAGL